MILFSYLSICKVGTPKHVHIRFRIILMSYHLAFSITLGAIIASIEASLNLFNLYNFSEAVGWIQIDDIEKVILLKTLKGLFKWKFTTSILVFLCLRTTLQNEGFNIIVTVSQRVFLDSEEGVNKLKNFQAQIIFEILTWIKMP